MSAITVPAGFVSLDVPLPPPPQYDLLAAATLVDPTTNRWLLGGWSLGHPPGPAFTHDPCSQGTFRVKPDPGTLSAQMSGRFQVGLSATCTSQGVGPDAGWLTDALEMAFQVYEGAAVERVLVSGDGHGSLGQYLGDDNVEFLSGSAEQPLRALELLETAIAEVEGVGNGIIHVSPAVATAWISQTLLFPKGKVMRTGLGTAVAVGAGYIGAIPDDEGTPAAGNEWAFASGLMQILRGDIEIVARDRRQSMDRTLNDDVFIAERPYLINWIGRQDTSDDEHVQAAVLVDLSP